MYIKEIKWLDEDDKEAIVTVISQEHHITCFSHPCEYIIGDILKDPLECLNIEAVKLCEIPSENIEKLEHAFNYKIQGKLINQEECLLEVYGFKLHLDCSRIPNDINEGAYIQFISSRIDIW